jgi:hypothetical protein
VNSRRRETAGPAGVAGFVRMLGLTRTQNFGVRI